MATWDLRNGHIDYNDSSAAATGNLPTNLRLIGTLSASGGVDGSGTSPFDTYLAPGAGAVPRMVVNKLSDLVSVLDYGAVCDGVTDDTSAVNRALATGLPVLTPNSPTKTTGPLGIIAPGTLLIQGIPVGASPIPADISCNSLTATTFVASGVFRSLNASGPVTLRSLMVDAPTALGAVIDTPNAYTAGTGARLLSVRSGGVERFYVDPFGSLIVGGSGQSANIFVGTVLSTTSLTTLGIKGGSGNNSTAVAVKMGVPAVLNVAGAKIISFYPDNFITEKAYLDIFGAMKAGSFDAFAAASAQLRGNVADGATAIGNKIGNASALSTAGSKVCSFYSDNLASEVAYVASNGTIASNATVQAGGSFLTTSGQITTGASVPLRVVGGVPDGATAIGVKLANTPALTVAGAKIASFYSDNVITEKAFVDLAGKGSFSGGLSPGTDALAAQTGRLFQGSGLPNNANGANGDFYLRTDTPGVANQQVYIRNAGVWTGIAPAAAGGVTLQGTTPGTMDTGNVNISGTLALAGTSATTGSRISAAANTLTINSAAAPTSSQPIVQFMNAGSSVVSIGTNSDSMLKLNGIDGLATTISTASANSSLHLVGQPLGTTPSVVVDTPGVATAPILDIRNNAVSKATVTALGLVRLTNQAAVDNTAWTAITLDTGFTAQNGFGYFKDAFGFFHLRGSVRNVSAGVNSGLVTTTPLPATLRPIADRRFLVPVTGSIASAACIMGANGSISLVTSLANGDEVWLDQVTYLCNQ